MNLEQKPIYSTGLQIKQNNGIHIPFNKNGKASGEAYVQFETMEDCNKALERNMNKLGHRLAISLFGVEQSFIVSFIKRDKNRRLCAENDT